MALQYAAARQALSGGDRLFITYPDPNKASDRISYGLVGSGQAVNGTAARRLLRECEPAADGLLGTDGAQSFRLKQ